MTGGGLDPEEWDKVIGQMLRYHQNITDEIRAIIARIRQEMKEELVPVAEERANYGKIVKSCIRSMWALEYEIEDIQKQFAKQLGSIDINNLTDDFVEEALLQSKPLQGVLHAIRERQKVKMEEMRKKYGEHINNLEPLRLPRPPKPPPKPEEPAKKEGEVKPEAPKAPAVEAPPAPAVEAPPAPAVEAPPAPAAATVAEPEPAVEQSQAPQVVEASA